MASNTPNLSLRKPTNQDLVNVATDLSANFDKIDAHVTSATAHSGTYVTVGRVPINVKEYGAVGDGTTDDTTALLSAYSAALSSGRSVFVPAGTYIVRPNQHKIDGGGTRFHLYADGATFKASSAGPTGTPGTDRPVFYIINVADVRIEGLKIDGNRSVIGTVDWTNYIHGLLIDAATTRAEVVRCQVTAYPSIGIYLKDSDNCLLEDCEASNGMYHGFHMLRCDRITVRRNKFTGIGNQGTNAQIGGIGILVTKGSHAELVANYIAQASDTGTKTEGCDYVVYRDNYVEECGKDGIKIQAYSPDVTEVTTGRIVNNTVKTLRAWRSDGSGLINVHDVLDLEVSGNKVSGGLSTGTEVGVRLAPVSGTASATDRAVIADNIVGATVNEAILVTYADNVHIRGNICTKNISLSNTLGDLRIEDNSVRPASALAATSAIQAIVVEVAHVGRNIVTNCSTGILIQPGTTTKSVHVVGNTVIDIDGRAVQVKNFSGGAAVAPYVEIAANIGVNIGRNAVADRAFSVGTLDCTVGEIVFTDNHLVSAGSSGVTTFFAVSDAGTAATLATIARNVWPSAVAGPDYFTKITRTLGEPRSSAAPAAGTWAVGDVVYHPAPSAGNPYAFVCVTAGTPGTWKNVGIVDLLATNNSWGSQTFASSSFSGSLNTTRAAGSNPAYNAKITGDSVDRLSIAASGQLSWSDGSATADVTLARNTANVLGMGANDALRIGRDTTANRPSASTVGNGGMFYDTDLSKPIFSDGTTWRDAAGTAV